MGEQAAVGRGTVSLYAANVVSLTANTLYYVLLTNLLNSTIEVGVVTSLNILIWLLVVICVFAQPIVYMTSLPAPLAVLKFVPEFLAKNEHGGAGRVFRASLSSAILLGLVFAVILLALPSLVVPFLGGQSVLPDFVRLSAVDVLVIAVGQVCLGTVIALGDANTGGLYIIIWSIARYSMASIFLVHFGVVGVLVGWILGDATLLAVALRKTLHSLDRRGEAGSFSVKELFRYNLYTLFAGLVGFVINQSDRLITLSEQGLARLAIYNVAMAGASVASYAPYALVTVLLPAAAALFASKRTNELHAIIRSYTRYISLFVMPIAFGLAALMEIPLRMFGVDYVSGMVPAVIVSVSTGLTAVGAVYAGVLLALGKLRSYTLANLLGLLALIVVAATTTPFLGLDGPALGRASLLIVTTIFYGVAVIRAGISELDLKAYLASIAGSALMGVVMFVLVSTAHSFLLKVMILPGLCVVGLLIYLGCLRTIRLFNTSDIDFIHDILPKRFRVLVSVLAKICGIEYE